MLSDRVTTPSNTLFFMSINEWFQTIFELTSKPRCCCCCCNFYSNSIEGQLYHSLYTCSNNKLQDTYEDSIDKQLMTITAFDTSLAVSSISFSLSWIHSVLNIRCLFLKILPIYLPSGTRIILYLIIGLCCMFFEI